MPEKAYYKLELRLVEHVNSMPEKELRERLRTYIKAAPAFQVCSLASGLGCGRAPLSKQPKIDVREYVANLTK